MAVHRDDGLIDIGHPVKQGLDDAAKLGGDGVAHGIGDIDCGGTGLDGGLHHTAEVVDGGAPGVFTGELHIIGKLARILDGVGAHLQHILEALAQLALHMDGGGGEEGVDTELLGHLQRLGGGEDVLFQGAGEGADPAVLDVAGYGLHRFEITRRGDGEAHLHDVNAQPLQGQRDLQLLLDRQAGGKRLLTVP